MEKYPPWERIASPTDLRNYYESARNEIINYKKMANMANVTSKELAKDKRKYQAEAKVAKGQVVKLSKKQKALARIAKPRNKITGADFKKLKKKKKKTKGLLA